ncbi:MAG: type II toxin-antitoxin system RatA family toxin [Gammaproteobacteria bacterium]|nr:type II toxin-antitoxin system RatA family toxin [Gammaproteobacteria bacterium]
MDSIDRSALLPYTPHEMFVLVIDAGAYPQFLPWCCGAEVLSFENDEMVARINFAVGGVSKSFTTRNRHQPDTEVSIELVDGPFSQLQGRWRFEPLGEQGCKISLFLEYDFSSKVVGLVVGPVFSQIANSLVDAFQKRAVEVYGQR